MDFLTVIAPDGTRSRRGVEGSILRIGRASSNDLVLPDASVSRTHAVIERADGGVVISDAHGMNGTLVNGTPIAAPTRLRAGDRIRVGATVLLFNDGGSEPVAFEDDPGAVVHPTTTLHVEKAGVAATAGILYEANAQLPLHESLERTLEFIMDLIERATHLDQGSILLLEDGRLVPRLVRSVSGAPLVISTTITRHVIETREAVVVEDAAGDARFQHALSVESHRLRSVVCVPLWNNREVIGVVYLDHRGRRAAFDEAALRLLTQLANVAAVKIEMARLLERVKADERMRQEIVDAARIQSTLLPAVPPAIPGYDLFGRSIPCLEVGGDYFDYLPMDDGRCAVALGDVAGHGLAAALLMCSVQASLRAIARPDVTPADTLARLNKALCTLMPENRFVTLFYGILDSRRHEMTYAIAGHPAPVLTRSDGSSRRLEGAGLALGILPAASFGQHTIGLASGDVLACFSDGVTEAGLPEAEGFGDERLLRHLSAGADRTPSEMFGGLIEALDQHGGGRPRQDDTTAVFIKRVNKEAP